MSVGVTKGQLISEANCKVVNSSKKRTNEFVFTTMQRVFVCFLEEIEDIKKTFRNYLTFSKGVLLASSATTPTNSEQFKLGNSNKEKYLLLP